MKTRSFTLTLCLVTTLFVTGLPLAEVDNDGPLSSSRSVTKSGSKVTAHASFNASNAADEGWLGIHGKILHGTDYEDSESYSFDGYVQETVTAERSGVPVSNGYAYCSAWCNSSDGYHSILIDVQGSN